MSSNCEQLLNKFRRSAPSLLKEFDDKWNCEHFNIIKKCDEFWYKYDKLYYGMNENDKNIFRDISFEGTYRRKYLTQDEEEKYIKWLDKLIPCVKILE